MMSNIGQTCQVECTPEKTKKKIKNYPYYCANLRISEIITMSVIILIILFTVVMNKKRFFNTRLYLHLPFA